LDILTHTDALATVHRVGEQVRDLLGRVFTHAGIEHTFAGPASMLGIHFTPTVPQTYRDWRKTNSSLYRAFCWQLIDRGVMLEPDSREPWFFCEAHQHMDLLRLFKLPWLHTQHKQRKALVPVGGEPLAKTAGVRLFDRRISHFSKTVSRVRG
jgi:glutamate-1-semialdehyde aminotransferase